MLTLRVNALLSAPPNADAAKRSGSSSKAPGSRPNEGDEWVRVEGMKLIADGGFEGGWMRDALSGAVWERRPYRGLQLIPTDRYIGIVKELNRLGWRVGTHAVGDAAIDQVLAGYEAANAERSIVGKRWAIEHGFLPREEHFARMKALGLVVTVQNHLVSRRTEPGSFVGTASARHGLRRCAPIWITASRGRRERIHRWCRTRRCGPCIISSLAIRSAAACWRRIRRSRGRKRCGSSTDGQRVSHV